MISNINSNTNNTNTNSQIYNIYVIPYLNSYMAIALFRDGRTVRAESGTKHEALNKLNHTLTTMGVMNHE